MPRQQSAIGADRCAGPRLDRALINVGRHHGHRIDACTSKLRPISLFEASTKGSSESQSAMADHMLGCRRRSAKSLSTAAAVSSIDRRVTSMLGQLCLPQSRRENAISSATDLRSIYCDSS